MKGTCEYHRSEPQPAEPIRGRMVQLRCPDCGRKRGIRRMTDPT